MAIPFLNNINLSDNQLQNAKLHITGTAPTAAAAQIYFDSSDTIAKYYSNATDTWVSLVQTDFANGTFVSLTNGGTSIKRSYTVDLSAVDGTSTSASRFLTKDNTWATIPFGDVTEVQGGTNINVTDQTGPIPIVNLDDSITLAGTATAVTFLGDLNGTINTATTGTTQSAGDNSTLIATTAYADAAAAAVPISDYLPLSAGSSYPLTGDLYITKNSPILTITDTVASDLKLEIRQAGSTTSFTSRGGTSSTGQFNFRITNGSTTTNALFINQQARATFAGDVVVTDELTVSGTGQSSVAGQLTIPQVPSADTDAASKHYVDQAVTGALSYQGGYDAATNTPDLDSSPSSAIKTGWTYTVTVDGLFFTEQVRVGDVLIAEIDSPTALADWTTVQNNIDLADLTTVGIGNVNAGTGISVAYASGTATVTNTDINSSNTYAVTITDTATITHSLGTKDVIIQLYDVTTDETVYADVERGSTSEATITFAATPTNSVRVLVQKIG